MSRVWLFLLALLIGFGAGAGVMVLAPDLVGRYLPGALPGKGEAVRGKVVAKQRGPDRLLLTVLTPEGAVLVTFKKKVSEIDLLVEEGDTLTFGLRQYRPFVEDPVIRRVEKEEPSPPSAETEPRSAVEEEEGGPEPGETQPSPPDSGESGGTGAEEPASN